MKHISIILLLLLFGMTGQTQNENQNLQSRILKDTLQIDYYWGNGCPQCARLNPFIDELILKYPQVYFKKYEIYDHRENLIDLQHRFREFDISFKNQNIPAIFIGEECYMGYKDIKKKIENAIRKRLNPN